MALLLLFICIAVFIVGIILDWHIDEDIAFGMELFGGLGALIMLIVVIGLGVSVSKLNVIDDKIAMYQEENTRIEEQIAAVVEGYQDYESDIIKSVSPESSITLVSLYPELKADELVKSQIEIYTKNNEKIKSLKEKKISGSVTRWWLYFGG